MNGITAHRPCLGEDEVEAVRRVFASGWLGLGTVTEEFEARLAEMLAVRHVIAVNSCTSALHMALAAIELSAGDEIIVPSFTFPGTIQAIVAAGGRPVFCDIEPTTLNMDVADALSRVTSRTRAIIPVHYGGQPCELEPLLAESARCGLFVIEDAAHAFGSSLGGNPIGSIGDVTCFSFDPIKNITCGQGGAITTNSETIASRCRTMRMLGMVRNGAGQLQGEQYWHYEVASVGFRYHMNDFNAAIGMVQLDRLSEFTSRRRTLVQQYNKQLRGNPSIALLHRDIESICPFSYAVRVLDGRRNLLIEHLRKHDILAHVHFIPNHLQPVWFDSEVSLPVTEQIAGEVISLPLFFGLTDRQQARVISLVHDFYFESMQWPVPASYRKSQYREAV